MEDTLLAQHKAYKARTTKLTRKKLADFLFEFHSDKPALEIGAGEDHHLYFPNLKTLNIDPARKPDYVCDAENMRGILDDESFEIVLCMSVLEHTRHPQNVIDEAYRVLKPGGIFLGSVPFVFHLHDCPHDYWRFTKYGLQLMFERFDAVEIRDSMTTMETLEYLAYRMRLYTQTRYSRWIGKLVFEGLRRFFAVSKNMVAAQVVRGSDGKPYPESNILVSDYYVIARKQAKPDHQEIH